MVSRKRSRSHRLENPLRNDSVPTQNGVGLRDAGQAGSQYSSHDEPGKIVLTADPEILCAWWGAQSPGCHTWKTSQEWWHPSLFMWPFASDPENHLMLLMCPKGWKFNLWLTEGKAYILDLQRMFSQLILEPVLWLGPISVSLYIDLHE